MSRDLPKVTRTLAKSWQRPGRYHAPASGREPRAPIERGHWSCGCPRIRNERCYRRTSRLFKELTLARADGSYTEALARLARVDVLILDD